MSLHLLQYKKIELGHEDLVNTIWGIMERNLMKLFSHIQLLMSAFCRYELHRPHTSAPKKVYIAHEIYSYNKLQLRITSLSRYRIFQLALKFVTLLG
jgi:hypothetical protein